MHYLRFNSFFNSMDASVQEIEYPGTALEDFENECHQASGPKLTTYTIF